MERIGVGRRVCGGRGRGKESELCIFVVVGVIFTYLDAGPIGYNLRS